MKIKSFRFAEAFIGLFLTLFVAYSYFLCSSIFKDPAAFQGPGVFSWLEGLEFKLYDARSKLRTSIDAGEKEIVIVAIDDESLARLGRWPWPRTRIAQMVDLLAAAKPKVLGIEIVYSEPEEVQGADEIKKLQASFQSLTQSRQIVQRKGVDFTPEFDAALERMNFDAKLKDSFAKAGNVILPMVFAGGGVRGAKPEPMAVPIAASALKVHMIGIGSESGRNTDGMKPLVPIAPLLGSIQGVGHTNVYPDFDGTVRREYPAMKYDESFYPSFALALVTRYLGFETKDVVLTPNDSIAIGKNIIPLDSNGSMLISFNGPYNTFHNYSFFDVLNGKVSMDVFKDKIVLLGPSAAAMSSLYVTPVTHNLPATELMANVIENILHLKFLVRPEWAGKLEYGSIVVLGLFLMLVLPYLGAMWGAVVTLVILLALGGFGTSYFMKGLWLKVAYPGFLLAAGYVVITTKRFLVTEKGKELVEASAIETNKMLGLSFQGQGQLDLAFDKFRACPMDDSMRDLLYNLGLDFERKRQYNKAASVYEHIATKAPNYKDIADKTKMLKAAAQGAVFGGLGGKSKEGTVLITSGTSKPTLGRYEVEKELGRGAMGIVYLGTDPKINRKVAIKTMVLEEGSDAAALKETKERFFREAESAGTLNHPNIVRIFDAGEENDISFIAMEFLEGGDLAKNVTKGNLFPQDVVMEYVAKVADALDYANAQGIVHRDIKPANIMLLKDGSIRVTDFGIARITASSKTATGTVVGTPAYMSPEQVGGKKVDGRSDIFSLGVVLYEMLLGEKPFKGGEGGLGTLLFQIANDPEPDPLTVDPKLPAFAVEIIHKALKKDPAQRYQRAGEMASALRLCIKMMKDGKPAEAPAPKPEPAPAPIEKTAPPAPIAVPAPSLDIERTMPAGKALGGAVPPPPAPVAGPVEAYAPPAGLERPIPAGLSLGGDVPPPPAHQPGTDFERTMPAPVPEPAPAPEVLNIERTLSPEEIAAAITMPAIPVSELPAAAAQPPSSDFERTMPAGGFPPVQAAPGAEFDQTMPAGGFPPVQAPAKPAPNPSGIDLTLPNDAPGAENQTLKLKKPES